MDHAIRVRRRGSQRAEIVEGGTQHLGTGGRDLLRGRIRASEPDDRVPGGEQIADDGETDVTGRAGDEDTHGNLLMSDADIRVTSDVSDCNQVASNEWGAGN